MHFTQNWKVVKPAAHSRGGIVASQSHLAAQAGARVLKAGGNAVDAAIATGFALSATEPWNSGIGGVGFMLVYLAKARRVEVVDFGPIAPCGLDLADYRLTGGVTRELFTWPQVEGDRNVQGPKSIAVPGHVAGMGLAHERFGTLPWAQLLAPAIELAEEGMPVDWFLTLKIALTARDLARFPTSAAVWLDDGLPHVTPAGAPLRRMMLTGLAGSLKRIAQGGAREYYEGALAADIAADLKALDGNIDAGDLAAYRARMQAPLEMNYRDARLALAPALTAGPSMRQALQGLAARKLGRSPDAETFITYAEELRAAYRERLTNMGEASDAASPACTSHFNVIDRAGNMVACTQTLLSVFGSRFVLPKTGILMNNGIFWFDPRPGVPNSLAPGKRPLTNMCPVIGMHGDGQGWFALGGSGGRKIFPAIYQLVSMMVDFGMDLPTAWHQPRIDASGGEHVGLDPRLDAEVKRALAARFPVQETELLTLPNNFACPSAVRRDQASGEHSGISDVMSPWSAAVSEEMV